MGIPDEFWIGFVIMVGFFLKLIYDTRIGWNAGTVGAGLWMDIENGHTEGAGHLAVLHYYFTHHMLPGIDPRTAPCFSNPPLYYITSSLLLEILNRLLGWSISISIHLVQSMNVIYVMIGECCGIGILQKYGIRGRKLVVSVLFLLFFPTFYHLSGAMDGSAMCFMYMMLALNSSLSWFASRRKKALRSAAICIGLGLLVSPCAAIVLPPVIYLIRKGATDGRRNDTPVGEQARMFAIIVAVMGLSWQIYQMIRFGLPLFYVNTSAMTPTTGSFMERLSIPSLSMLTHLHTEGVSALESNVIAQTLKTAVLDFTAVNIETKPPEVIACFLVFLVLAIAVLQHAMTIRVLLSMRIDHVYAVFLIIGELTCVAGYLAVCCAYPFTEIMNFKAIAPVMIFPLVGTALLGGENTDGAGENLASAAMSAMILVMSLVTAFLYGYYAI